MASHFRFVRDHHKHIKKIAVIHDSQMGNVAEHLASHFVAAEIRHFSAQELAAAKQMVMGIDQTYLLRDARNEPPSSENYDALVFSHGIACGGESLTSVLRGRGWGSFFTCQILMTWRIPPKAAQPKSSAKGFHTTYRFLRNFEFQLSPDAGGL